MTAGELTAEHPTAAELVVPAPIDPLVPLQHGAYSDDLVRVTRGGRAPAGCGDAHRTPHFELWRDGHRLHLAHTVGPGGIDDDLAGMLAEELFRPGWVTGPEIFERLLTGIVRTSCADPLGSWELYYRNTLAKLDRLAAAARRPAGAASAGHGSLAGFAPVYRRVLELTGRGSVLEMGCCFGFLSLQQAERGNPVLATDLSAGTVGLLSRVAPRLGLPVATLACDAARVPRPDCSADVVLAVHLLEHLEPEHGRQVLAEACRLARRRVIVAVPYENEPDHAFGHVRTLDTAALRSLGEVDRWHSTVTEFHGGLLVMDREVVGGSL